MIWWLEFKSWWRQKWNAEEKLYKAFGIAVVTAFCALVYFANGKADRLDFQVLRYFFDFRGMRPPPDDLVLVAIDRESYKALGASPNLRLPREYIATALEQIVGASPKALIIDANIPRESGNPAADSRIEAALRAGPTTIGAGQVPQEPSLSIPSDNRFRSAAKLELPMDLRADRAGMDGILGYMCRYKASFFDRIPTARALVELAKINVSEPGLNDFINFYGPADTIQKISLHRLVKIVPPKIEEQFRGKVVLMGYQSMSIGKGTSNNEEFNVPVSEKPMFGVEIHANIVGNLIDRTWLKRSSKFAECWTIFIAAFVTTLIGLHLSPGRNLLFTFCVMAGAIVGAYVAFDRYHRWFGGIGTLLVVCLVSFVVSLFIRIGRTEAFRKWWERTITFKAERQM